MYGAARARCKPLEPAVIIETAEEEEGYSALPDYSTNKDSPFNTGTVGSSAIEIDFYKAFGYSPFRDIAP